MTAPGEGTADGFLVVCEDHGELREDPAADRVVADMLKEEHRDQGCDSPVNVYRASDLEFTPGGHYAVDADGEDDQLQSSFPDPGGEAGAEDPDL